MPGRAASMARRRRMLDRGDRLAPGKPAEDVLREREERLRQAEKMEAMGSLAGGVAHDFNNLLSVILSYSDMLAADLEPDSAKRADLEEIKAAGIHAANLTRQLLAFSRQQILRPSVLDPNAIVAGLERLLRRLIGADVVLYVIADAALGKVNADPGQVEQIITNLVVNARDAMPSGGKVTIETSNAADLGAEHDSEQLVGAGPYVVLTVTDTGTGMARATRERIFDPFFTTKPGKGTGLGLATVFGIVRQSGGHIAVHSEPGAGTTFKIYLPCTDPAAGEVPPVSTSERIGTPRGSETILLVEDDERVRALAHVILERYGYQVIDAQDGRGAWLACERHGSTIHLLLTDVVILRTGASRLVQRLREARPMMKVLYMSGYAEDPAASQGSLYSDVAFLQKPITPDALARKVRDVLDADTGIDSEGRSRRSGSSLRGGQSVIRWRPKVSMAYRFQEWHYALGDGITEKNSFAHAKVYDDHGRLVAVVREPIDRQTLADLPGRWRVECDACDYEPGMNPGLKAAIESRFGGPAQVHDASGWIWRDDGKSRPR